MWSRLEVYARRSFNAVNFHDIWSNYPRKIFHVIDLVYEKWRATWGRPKFWGMVTIPL